MRSIEVNGPYSFTVADLQQDRMSIGVAHTLAHYEQWREANPSRVAEHVHELTERVREASTDYNLLRRLGRMASPSVRRAFVDRTQRDYIDFFGVHNLGVILDDAGVDFFQDRTQAALRIASPFARRKLSGQEHFDLFFETTETLSPELKATGLVPWLKERVLHLQQILPETVLQEGGMGKVVRTMLGVLMVASYDVAHEPMHVKKEHMERAAHGAYVLGATYALVDDVMQSSSGDSVPSDHKDTYHKLIQEGLATGEAIDSSPLPDHPLAEELIAVYDALRHHYPFKDYRHLYAAIETMYGAQHRESQRTLEEVALSGIKTLYPDMALKSAATRIVTNLLGRRSVADFSLSQFANHVFGGQLKDDLEDHVPDRKAGHCTPFTVPYDGTDPTNPLYDLFAYDAYVVDCVWKGHPTARSAYVRYSSSEVACYLARYPHHAQPLLDMYPHTKEIAQFIHTAIGIPPRRAERIDLDDVRLEDTMATALSVRLHNIDPRTFVTDNLEFINKAIGAVLPENELLSEPARYALEAGGKRLRPALTLMLAKGLGISREHIVPLLQSIELLHTSSLVFDDLPAQDNATLRRGKPATHIQFGEWKAQLAGISMLSRAYGVLSELEQYFPAEGVATVLRYADSRMGLSGLCKGQAMDLLMEEGAMEATIENAIEMYHYKTSLAIEMSLVPLMLLAGRSEHEISLIQQFAHHAGIVFQIKDDILDVTATAEAVGKDTRIDGSKMNAVRLCGLPTAHRMMAEQLAAATSCLEELPFNTTLLHDIVQHFAHRKK